MVAETGRDDEIERLVREIQLKDHIITEYQQALAQAQYQVAVLNAQIAVMQGGNDG